jgi:chemosensory pili system protein ChpA (sensor histidine kinase/response regulator)
MAADPAANFDVGPLTWVKTEIEHSLTEARQHLDKVAADPADGKALKYVATHLHQVTGALSMVNLGTATRFNEEIEKIVAAMEQDSGNTAALAATAKKGISALSGYLDSLIAGHPDRPMMLASAYVELNRAGGASDAAESDLFHPDLSASLAPPGNTVVEPSKEMLARSLKQKRATFQAGLLKLLKEKDFATGLRIMRDAVLGIEALQLRAPSRMFWFTTSGFFDAVAHNTRELGSIAVTLFGKVDQQIRLQQDGVQKVPERLFRDLLLVIGKSGAQTTRVRQIRELYRLDDLLAQPGATRGENADDGLKSVVRNLRELTQTQKENWLRFASGNDVAIEAFATQGDLLVAAAASQPNTDLAAVFKALSNVGATLRASGVPPSEAVALEIATVLLFIENSLENYFTLSSEFASQAKTVASRVASTMAGVSLPPLDPAASGLMDGITKRAQERLLLFQVGQEVQVNLQSIEQELDVYFRDPLKTGQLPGLAALFAQAGGALTILELDEAAALNQLLSQRVSQFASGARKGEGEDADAVAEGISALGLYVSALQQGQSNPREVLLPTLIRFNLAAKPVEQQPVAEMVSDADIEAQKQKAQSLFEEWKQKPEQMHTRDQLKQVVSELKRNAELVSDSAVAKQSGEALSLLEQAEAPGKTGLHEAFDVIAPVRPAVPAELPSAQVVQLLDKEGAEIDAELLQIFLEEAREVVGTINENLDIVRGQPHDREAMTTIRRGFHTMKGSGRMVGLIDLGEVAWQAEQVMNKWLKEETPPSHGLLRFIELASDSFSAWVTKLQESGNAQVDGSDITRIAEALKNDKEPDFGAAAPAAIEGVPPQFELPALDLAAAEVAQPTERIAEPVMPAVEIAPEPIAVAGLPAAPDEEEMQIGEVVISKALFSIFLGEADQHIATLNNEMRAIEVNPLNPVSHEFMRAAHTLNSSSLTTGFLQIADVAFVLEKWLQDAIELPPQFDAHRLDVTRRAVDALTMMVGDLAEQNAPLPRDDVVLELKELRDSLAEARRTGEGSHVRMPRMSAPGADVPAEAVEPSALEEAKPSPEEALDFLNDLIPATPAAKPASIPVAEPAIESALQRAPEFVPVAAMAAGAAAPAAPTVRAAEASQPPAQWLQPSEPAAEAEEDFEAGKEKRRIQDDIDNDLLPIFLDEAKEIVPQVGDALRAWKARPADHTPMVELVRHLHTLKGSARMAGLMRLGELAHVLETKVIAMDAEAMPAAPRFDDVDDYFDRFTGSLDRLQRGEDIGTLFDIPVTDVFEQQKDKPGTIAVMAAAAQVVREDVVLEGRERQALLRVNADLIDRLVNEAGELSIARSRIDGEVISFKRALIELTDNIGRMKSQLREIEIEAETQIASRIKELEAHAEGFDPLEFDRFTRMQEVARFLAESLSDVVTLHVGLQRNIDEAEAALLQQGRLSRDLQQGLMGVRLVPLGNLQDRLYRVVRQTAKELGKKANLEFRGARVELDRSVLEKITAPFEHLLRNAVSHGLETPEERIASGKAEIGEITLAASQVGNEVVLTISDDGAGLNYVRIRQKAIESKLLDPATDMPDEQLVQYIFIPGFSTATEVTQIAGRGVGMEVVRSEITSLGGRLEISSVTGKGTSFTITLPLTLAVTQAVMVKIGEDMFAIPSVMIEQVQEYRGKKYDALLEMQEIDWKGNRFPLRSLHALLGGTAVASVQRKAAVILAKSGTLRAAVQVDEIIGNREIVVKSIGPQLARLVGVAGATVLGNGQIVLILNPVQLVFRETATVAVEHTAGAETASGTAVPVAVRGALALPGAMASTVLVRSTAPLVMVVDDSLTVRKITSRMLTREGFEVATAKDGVDGLKQLQDIKPDIILLDIEMPRMNGFEFARNIRADAKTKNIPIIMITSRTADKHRNRAMELGVKEYMGKPYQEDQLLALIRTYVGSARASAAA